jgi:hypothetical protein
VAELAERIGIILLGIFMVCYFGAYVANYRGMADRKSLKVFPEGARKPNSYYANTRPIVIRITTFSFVLLGLAIIGCGVLGQNVETLAGGVYFGILAVLAVVDVLVGTVVSNWIHYKRDQETKYLRRR